MNRQKENHRNKFTESVNKKENQRIKGRSTKQYNAFAWLGMMGIVGWSVTIPMLLGIAIGAWIDRTYPSRCSFTVMLLVAGLAVGCAAAWIWCRRHCINCNRDSSSKNTNTQDGDSNFSQP